MSSGQRKRHDGWNKSIMRDGVIVILRKDGREKCALTLRQKNKLRGANERLKIKKGRSIWL